MLLYLHPFDYNIGLIKTVSHLWGCLFVILFIYCFAVSLVKTKFFVDEETEMQFPFYVMEMFLNLKRKVQL